MSFESIILAGLPIVMTVAQPEIDKAVDAAADNTIAAVKDSNTRLDDVAVKALAGALRRFADRVESGLA